MGGDMWKLKAQVACIDKASIERLVGPLRSIMGKRNAQAMEDEDDDDDKGSEDMDLDNVTPDVDDAYDLEDDMSERRVRRLSMAVRGRRRTAVCTEATPGHAGWVPRKPAHGHYGAMFKTTELHKRLCAALKVLCDADRLSRRCRRWFARTPGVCGRRGVPGLARDVRLPTLVRRTTMAAAD